MNQDRITEVYDGLAGSPGQQTVARRRVHWLCQRVEPGSVLDVGCSQGICSLLLGREAHEVVGIDREAEAIAFACERLEQEELRVQDRVRFMQAEASSLPFDDHSFDNVLLGEVLEHLVQPEPPLAEAFRVLRPGGRLIVTTPYGLLAYPDHKEPLYLADLFALLEGRFVMTELELIERYLGIVAVSPPAPEGAGLPSGLALEIAEARLAEQDRTVESQRRRIQRLTARADQAERRQAELHAKLSEAVEARAGLQVERDTAAAEIDTLRAELDATHAELDAMRAELDAMRSRAARHAAELETLKGSRTFRVARAVWRIRSRGRWAVGAALGATLLTVVAVVLLVTNL